MTKKMIVKRSLPRIRRVEQLFNRISVILEAARRNVIRTINTEMVQAYWLIGQEIVEEEQQGRARAEYGEGLIKNLSQRLRGRYGKGFTPTLLKRMRQFYLSYKKGASTRLQLDGKSNGAALRHYSDQSWPLSWTHYRRLIAVASKYARSFYEAEAIENNWSARELERQINSLLFERLAKSRDKKGLMRLAQKGQEIQTPADAVKDPFVLEFLNLPESHKLIESNLEQALITDLQNFLLELGKGFAFIERQSRLTLDGDHFYVDLVFYHAILKCYVLIDLKTTKLTHGDLGQMQLYVNYFDQERRAVDDNPTIGLILCADKNDAMVKYMLGQDKKKIFASRYKLHLPSEKELANEIRKELRGIRQA